MNIKPYIYHITHIPTNKCYVGSRIANKVNGSVKLKLYKGNITILSRKTKSNEYSIKKVSFEENKTFNKSNVERFIKFHKGKQR